MLDSSVVRVTNREFLDTYLEYGIGHYYTIAKLLSSRASEQIDEAEKLSLGIEVSALASAALDNLVTWYYALSQWRPRGNEEPLADILAAIHLDDSQRLEALRSVRETTASEFCRVLGIPWGRSELRASHIDAENWRYTVDQAKLNIAKVLEDLSPARINTSRAWVVHYLNYTKHGLLVGAGQPQSYPAVRVESEGGRQATEGDATDLDVIHTDQESLDKLAMLTGNAAIGLFLLMRLRYVTAFGREPRSPAFVIIWQELFPSPGRGP